MAVDSFRTVTGLVVPAVTTTQMREVDRVAVEEVGPNLYQMMENAGRNLAALCTDLLSEAWHAAPIVVLAGPGGNGGGGICAARHLANHGGDVTLVVANPAQLSGVPADKLTLYGATDGRRAGRGDLGTLEAALVVDAVLGYSLRGAPDGAAAELIGWASAGTAPVVCLDAPSGLDATTGAAPGQVVRATTTMTLALPKTGLDAAAVGRLWLADIGIPREVYRRVGVRPPDGLFTAGYRVELAAAAGDPAPS